MCTSPIIISRGNRECDSRAIERASASRELSRLADRDPFINIFDTGSVFSSNNERAFTRAALHVTRPVNEKPHFLTLQIASSSLLARLLLVFPPAFIQTLLRRAFVFSNESRTDAVVSTHVVLPSRRCRGERAPLRVSHKYESKPSRARLLDRIIH